MRKLRIILFLATVSLYVGLVSCNQGDKAPVGNDFTSLVIKSEDVVSGAEVGVTYNSDQLDFVGINAPNRNVLAVAYDDHKGKIKVGLISVEPVRDVLVEVVFTGKVLGNPPGVTRFQGLDSRGQPVQVTTSSELSTNLVSNPVKGYDAMRVAEELNALRPPLEIAHQKQKGTRHQRK